MTTSGPEATGRCDECGGKISISDCEKHCADCGLVTGEPNIDRGPEWRAFNHSERQSKSRVGTPLTETMHDGGLTTTISWRNTDSSGRSLSPSQRRRMSRIRRTQKIHKTKNSRERTLVKSLSEISRMIAALGLPDHVHETAAVMFKTAADDGILPGRSIEEVATATVYASCRMHGPGRPLMTVISVSRVDKNRVTSAYQALVRSLNLEVAPPEPDVYVSTAAGKLDAPWEVEQLARQLLRSELSYCVGKSPHTLAPAAVYAAAQLHDGSYTTTQSQAAATTGTSTVSVRTRAHELLSLAGHNSAEVIRS